MTICPRHKSHIAVLLNDMSCSFQLAVFHTDTDICSHLMPKTDFQAAHHSTGWHVLMTSSQMSHFWQWCFWWKGLGGYWWLAVICSDSVAYIHLLYGPASWISNSEVLFMQFSFVHLTNFTLLCSATLDTALNVIWIFKYSCWDLSQGDAPQACGQFTTGFSLWLPSKYLPPIVLLWPTNMVLYAYAFFLALHDRKMNVTEGYTMWLHKAVSHAEWRWRSLKIKKNVWSFCPWHQSYSPESTGHQLHFGI